MAAPRAGVLLDVDGTLLDTNYLHALAWWQAMRDGGVEGVTMADCHQAVGIGSEELVRRLAGRDDDAVVEAHSTRYDALQDQVVAFDRSADLVQKLAGTGLAVVLATSGRQQDLEWMLPAIGVEDGLIDGSTTSGDVERAKPHPDLLTTAMEQHGLDPARTVAVGDTVWDVQAAHDAGIRVVAFTTGGIPRCQLEQAGADEVWSGPADLLEHWSSSLLAALA
ncbi:HAD family hydrolase [Microlunatus capsulatus]|uniref:Phosphoglycolate phosphatase-like HAD superfamily hydrolase n=1 Tax=Microlunatus capsulatus TaxID=99117 RepID=A0ABS4Z662_9ACTN|nr:HAD family hydrolase [Microlunatus capsulatus]MBP2416538.1 phosphoglycolate phosphatase-like HAD superfamily hydrolase [Microlunatus capsulatus]